MILSRVQSDLPNSVLSEEWAEEDLMVEDGRETVYTFMKWP